MLDFFQNLDNILLIFIQENLRNNILDFIMPMITKLGDVGAIWILITLVFLSRKKYMSMGIMLMIALIASTLVGSLVLKPLIARPRPFELNPDIVMLISLPTDYSFPSGHTSAAFASAAVLLMNHKRFGIYALILGSLIAFSRMYLFVHYPTDVLAGILLGTAAGVLSVFFLKKY